MQRLLFKCDSSFLTARLPVKSQRTTQIDSLEQSWLASKIHPERWLIFILTMVRIFTSKLGFKARISALGIYQQLEMFCDCGIIKYLNWPLKDFNGVRQAVQ